MGATAKEQARGLAIKLRGLKAGMRFGYGSPMVHPALRPDDRDLIVMALERLADGEIEDRK
jgi:hypothetical protein